jgi:SOS-response transcriptional repressor LexA
MAGNNYRRLDKDMLTPRQLKLFKFLIEYKKENEIMPTFREMCVHMNAKSTSSIAQMLGYIEWKGYIKRYPAHARAITILREVA